MSKARLMMAVLAAPFAWLVVYGTTAIVSRHVVARCVMVFRGRSAVEYGIVLIAIGVLGLGLLLAMVLTGVAERPR